MKNKSGIYKWTNIVNGKVYIGRTKCFYRRYHQYKNGFKFKKLKYINEYMLNSMNKHGWENFKFEIIEFCSNDLTPERELFWIKKFNSTDKNKGYNIRADVSGKMILDSRTSEKISSRLRKEWLSGVRDSHSDKLKFSWMNRDRDEQSRLMRKNLTRYKYEVKNSAIVKTVSYSELGDLKNVIATFHRKKTDTVLFKGYTITRICI